VGVSVLDEGGQRVPVIMGSYGIGVERAMSAIVECHHDERGIIWPIAVAPFQVAVVVAQVSDAETAALGERVYQDLRPEVIVEEITAATAAA
jgi:prolyl-tRNA synthetase